MQMSRYRRRRSARKPSNNYITHNSRAGEAMRAVLGTDPYEQMRMLTRLIKQKTNALSRIKMFMVRILVLVYLNCDYRVYFNGRQVQQTYKAQNNLNKTKRFFAF